MFAQLNKTAWTDMLIDWKQGVLIQLTSISYHMRRRSLSSSIGS